MKVCDICKAPAKYECGVQVKPDSFLRSVDFCGACYNLYIKKKNLHDFLAYQETVNERVSGEIPKKKEFWRR